MNLVIDIGNSLIKITGFDGLKPVEYKIFDDNQLIDAEDLIKEKSHIYNNLIISSVRKELLFPDTLFGSYKLFMRFEDNTPVPLVLKYDTPKTLGPDRLAAAVAAASLYPGKDALAILAGTCITYEFINKNNEYTGGAISPGLMMRFKALNTFTGKLPLVNKPVKLPEITGKTTQESILSGVIWGAINEIDGFVNEYKAKYPELNVVFSGGDAFFFDKMLKNRIFVTENLVSYGLNQILLYNAEKDNN